MIIVLLLLLFQSICLHCQRLVLYVHDRWINPKNARLLKEAAEKTLQRRHNPLTQLQKQQQILREQQQVVKRRRVTGDGRSGASDSPENCRFCANTPQGYCRHHFHLQELQVQQHQQKQQQQQQQHRHQQQWHPSRCFWNPLKLVTGAGEQQFQELRQLRKINRELRRNLQQQQQQQRERRFHRYNHWKDPQELIGESQNARDSGYSTASSITNLTSPEEPVQLDAKSQIPTPCDT